MRLRRTGRIVEAERSSDGARESWRVSYVVGCDGGHSFVRRMLGAHYRGFDALQQQYMGGRMIASHIRARTLLRERPARSSCLAVLVGDAGSPVDARLAQRARRVPGVQPAGKSGAGVR